MGKTVLEVNVKGVEKRRHPNKHYVYIIEVTWSEGTTTVIYRRYSRFFDFQCHILEKFPLEGGIKDPTQRIIPFLPGKKLLGRSHVRNVAQKRLIGINEYCKALIRLPQNISDDSSVIEFFEVTGEDINPTKEKKKEKSSAQDAANIISDPILLEQYVAIGDYKKDKKNECSLKAGQTVEVVEKNENGWWFVNVDNCHEGWVPATFLEPLGDTDHSKPERLAPGKEEVYISTNVYSAQNSDEVTFEKGVLVEVLQKGLDGWWSVRYKGREGMAPSAYLEKYNQSLPSESAMPTQLVSTPSEAAASSKPAAKTKSSPPVIKSKTILDVKSEHTGWGVKTIGAAAATAKTAPPRKESIKRKPIKVTKASTRSRQSVSSESAEVYVTVADFSDQAGDGLTFKAGAHVEVITKNSSGWWYVQLGNEEGWVPSSYLDKVTDASTHSQSNDKFVVPKKLTSSRSQDNVDQIGSADRSLANKQRTFTSKDNRLQLKESISTTFTTTGVPSVPRKHQTALKDSRRSPPPVPSAFHKRQKSAEAPLKLAVPPAFQKQQETKTPPAPIVSKRPVSPEAPQVKLRTATLGNPSGELASVLKKRFDSKSSATAGPPVISPRHKTSLDQNSHDHSHDHSDNSNKEKKVPPARPKQGPQKKQGPGRPAVSPALKHKLVANAVDAEEQGAKKEVSEFKNVPTVSNPPVVKKRSVPHVVAKPQPPKPIPRGSAKKKMYKALADYHDTDGGLSFQEGDILELLDDSDQWWFVKLGTVEGWAPSTYLEPV